MQLFEDRVYIIPDKKVEEVTQGGIILLESQSQKLPTGVVDSCGPSVKNVKPGDKVCFSRHEGEPLENGLLMREAGIIGIL